MRELGAQIETGTLRQPAGTALLFVDLFCPEGHLALNRVYLAGLVAAGARVDCVLKQGYAERLNVAGLGTVYEFPERYFEEKCGALRARWNQWVLLGAIRAKLNVSCYGCVFFSSFDELALAMSGRWPGAVLLNHANIASMDNLIKRWAMLGQTDDSTFIVFHEFIARQARERGLRRVQTLPLGLSMPYKSSGDINALLTTIDPRLGGGRSRRIIFVPSGAKYADGFIRRVCMDEEFVAFLEAQGVVLAVKGLMMWEYAPTSVIGIARHLSEQQYRALFIASDCLVLHYPPTFTFRVSAIMMECFANRKPCLLSRIDGFCAFAKHFNYQPYYESMKELMLGIEELGRKPASGWCPYRDMDELTPHFGEVLPGWFRSVDRII